ncbi:UNVERIFIED_CONTAM: Kynurenine formamidase [Siphonaria sp. JEL0065]|nr:Kynurenine formamidase [Siphonaria sp. JEL0065]
MAEFLQVPYLQPNSDESDLRPEQSSAFNILDLHLPSASLTASIPLVVFIHGGAWRAGKPSSFSDIAKGISSRGFGVAVVGYRLSTLGKGEGPVARIKHPQHVKDVAAGVAWLLAASEGLVGSSEAANVLKAWKPKSFFVVGHSAGAQIGSILALDASFIQNALNVLVQGSATFNQTSWMNKIRGYIGVEGIYDIPLIIKNFPTYKDWFIDAAFGLESDNGWVIGSPTLTNAFNPPLTESINNGIKLASHLVIHSTGDELVDVVQSKEWYDKLVSLRTGTPGADNWVLHYDATSMTEKHDDVLLADRFYDLVANWIKSNE